MPSVAKSRVCNDRAKASLTTESLTLISINDVFEFGLLSAPPPNDALAAEIQFWSKNKKRLVENCPQSRDEGFRFFFKIVWLPCNIYIAIDSLFVTRMLQQRGTLEKMSIFIPQHAKKETAKGYFFSKIHMKFFGDASTRRRRWYAKLTGTAWASTAWTFPYGFLAFSYVLAIDGSNHTQRISSNWGRGKRKIIIFFNFYTYSLFDRTGGAYNSAYQSEGFRMQRHFVSISGHY